MGSLHRTGSAPAGFIQWAQLLKRISLVVLILLFLTSGTIHFLEPGILVKIIPPGLPAPRLLIYLSGLGEIAGALGLLLPWLRPFAAWGLVLLLLAVFPANVYMAVDQIQVTARPLPQWLLWARLPLQAVFIAWILWAARSNRRNSSV